MSNPLFARIEQHFDPDRRRRMEVPAWGEPAVLDATGAVVTPAKPLVITFLPVTLEDYAVLDDMKDKTAHHRAARLVALKACDEDGRRLFKITDAVFLRTKAEPDVVMGIFVRMVGDLTQEQAEKN